MIRTGTLPNSKVNAGSTAVGVPLCHRDLLVGRRYFCNRTFFGSTTHWGRFSKGVLPSRPSACDQVRADARAPGDYPEAYLGAAASAKHRPRT
jgi:hypothetical protein